METHFPLSPPFTFSRFTFIATSSPACNFSGLGDGCPFCWYPFVNIFKITCYTYSVKFATCQTLMLWYHLLQCLETLYSSFVRIANANSGSYTHTVYNKVRRLVRRNHLVRLITRRWRINNNNKKNQTIQYKENQLHILKRVYSLLCTSTLKRAPERARYITFDIFAKQVNPFLTSPFALRSQIRRLGSAIVIK